MKHKPKKPKKPKNNKSVSKVYKKKGGFKMLDWYEEYYDYYNDYHDYGNGYYSNYRKPLNSGNYTAIGTTTKPQNTPEMDAILKQLIMQENKTVASKEDALADTGNQHNIYFPTKRGWGVVQKVVLNGNPVTFVSVAKENPLLEDLQPEISYEIKNKIPKELLKEIVSTFNRVVKQSGNEAAAQIYRERTGDRKYSIYYPQQKISKANVIYRDDPNPPLMRINKELIMELHSHNTMGAFWSGTDDANEKECGFYMVIGRFDTERAQYLCRVKYGSTYINFPAHEIFDMTPEEEKEIFTIANCDEGNPEIDTKITQEKSYSYSWNNCHNYDYLYGYGIGARNNKVETASSQIHTALWKSSHYDNELRRFVTPDKKWCWIPDKSWCSVNDHNIKPTVADVQAIDPTFKLKDGTPEDTTTVVQPGTPESGPNNLKAPTSGIQHHKNRGRNSTSRSVTYPYTYPGTYDNISLDAFDSFPSAAVTTICNEYNLESLTGDITNEGSLISWYLSGNIKPSESLFIDAPGTIIGMGVQGINADINDPLQQEKLWAEVNLYASARTYAQYNIVFGSAFINGDELCSTNPIYTRLYDIAGDADTMMYSILTGTRSNAIISDLDELKIPGYILWETLTFEEKLKLAEFIGYTPGKLMREMVSDSAIKLDALTLKLIFVILALPLDACKSNIGKELQTLLTKDGKFAPIKADALYHTGITLDMLLHVDETTEIFDEILSILEDDMDLIDYD